MACLNEAGKIGRSVRAIHKTCGKLVDTVIVVDDGSGDHTYDEAKEAGADVIRHGKNLGAGAGYRSGYFRSLEKRTDITVEMAGDDQDDPCDILPLVSAIVDEGYDYVHGSRWLPGGRRINHPFSRSFLTRLYSVFFSFSSGYHATDATNGIRAFRTVILKNPDIRLQQDWLNRYELEPYFYYRVIRSGYRITERPVTKRYHMKGGNTKMIPFRSWWSISRPLWLLPLGLRT